MGLFMGYDARLPEQEDHPTQSLVSIRIAVYNPFIDGMTVTQWGLVAWDFKTPNQWDDLWVQKAFVVQWVSGWQYTYPSEKYESQLGLLIPIYGK